MPEHDDRALFELLTLEGAQAGLSWTTILRKREGYRAAFARFDPAVVARFTDARRRAARSPTRRSCATAARSSRRSRTRARCSRCKTKFGSFDDYVWGFVDGAPMRRAITRRSPSSPTSTDEAKALSEGPQAPRLPLRRPDDGLRVHAGGRPRRRPRRHLLPPHRIGPQLQAGLELRGRGAGARSPFSSASMRSSAMSWTLTSSSRPFSFTPSSIIT